MIARFLSPRTPQRPAKEVEAELQSAREGHVEAMTAKNDVLNEFRAFEKIVAQRR